jgi:Carbohydrate binding domain/TNFR/NGFR cysteine-rich region
MFTYTPLLRAGLLVSAAACAVGCVSQLDGIEGIGDRLGDAAPSPTGLVVGSAEPSVDPAATGTSPAAASATTPPAPPECAVGMLDSEGFCVREARCAPGTFRSEIDGIPVCAPCASGAFSEASDASECVPWATCVAGEFVETQGTSSTNRVCAACPEGESSSEENAGECNGATDCAAGTYKSDNTCVDCSPGSYCSGKTTEETPCESGTWDNDAQPGTPCIAVTDCTAGQYVLEAGTTTTDRSCEFCAEGTFSAEANAAACTELSDCEPGTYVALQGTTATDRECAECGEGTFSASSNTASCEAWSTCSAPANFTSVEPTTSTDRECAPCPAGQNAEADNAAACVANVVANGDFEAGSTGWVSWGGGTVSTTTVKAYTGTHSLLVSGPGTGPAATILDSVARAGATYNVSFWVSVGKVSTARVNLTRGIGCGGAAFTYEWVADNLAVPSSGWTHLTGAFTIPSDCASPKLTVYAEGSGANVDLYVDNVLIRKSL